MSSINIKNYWQDNSKSVKKLLLWLKAMAAMMVGSAYIQGEVKLCFYIMLITGILDGLLQLLPPDAGDKGAAVPPAATALLLLCLFAASCSVIKPGTNTTSVDSTVTVFKPVDFKVIGAKVTKGIDMDSLYHAALMARDQRLADSLAYLQLRNKWLSDSLAAAKANKPLPPKPVYIPAKPKIQYVTDPQTKAQLSYYIDAFGRLNMGCEAKDRTIQVLQQTVTRLQKQVSQTTQIAYKTPWYNWLLIGVFAALLCISLIKNLFKI
jgi:hypothetical protein